MQEKDHPSRKTTALQTNEGIEIITPFNKQNDDGQFYLDWEC